MINFSSSVQVCITWCMKFLCVCHEFPYVVQLLHEFLVSGELKYNCWLISLIYKKCVLKYSLLYNNYAQTAISEVWHFTHVEKGEGGLRQSKYPPTHTLLIDVSVPRQDNERSCMCLVGVLSPSLRSVPRQDSDRSCMWLSGVLPPSLRSVPRPNSERSC